MRRVKKACVSSSAMPSWWSTQPSRVTLRLKVRSPMAGDSNATTRRGPGGRRGSELKVHAPPGSRTRAQGNPPEGAGTELALRTDACGQDRFGRTLNLSDDLAQDAGKRTELRFSVN